MENRPIFRCTHGCDLPCLDNIVKLGRHQIAVFRVTAETPGDAPVSSRSLNRMRRRPVSSKTLARVNKLLVLLSVFTFCEGVSAKCASEQFIAEGTVTTSRGIWLEGAKVQLIWKEMLNRERSVETVTDSQGRYFLRFRFYPWAPREPESDRPYECDAVLEEATILVSAADHLDKRMVLKFERNYGSVNVQLPRQRHSR